MRWPMPQIIDQLSRAPLGAEQESALELRCLRLSCMLFSVLVPFASLPTPARLHVFALINLQLIDRYAVYRGTLDTGEA